MKIIKYAAVILKNNKFLIVRQKNQDYWKNVGRKPEGNETPEACLEREISEELGVRIKGVPKLYFSLPTTKAVSDPNVELDIRLYICQLDAEPNPSSEIDEIHWLSRNDFEQAKYKLTDQMIDYILPKLIEDELID